jgi:hypothetical protein
MGPLMPPSTKVGMPADGDNFSFSFKQGLSTLIAAHRGACKLQQYQVLFILFVPVPYFIPQLWNIYRIATAIL